MPNPLLNFCYNIVAKREEMQAEQENQPSGGKMKQKKISRAEARRAAAQYMIEVKRHNTAVRMEAYRGVRRPGRDHSMLFQALDQLIGNLEVKKEVISDVIFEALRFKRRALAQLLEEYIVELEMNEVNPNRDGFCAQCVAKRATSCTCKGRHIG